MVTKQSTTTQHGEDLDSGANGPGICDCGGPYELDGDSTVPTWDYGSSERVRF